MTRPFCAGTRESLLNAYHLNGTLQVDTIYAPLCHADIVGELIENTGNSIVVSTSPDIPATALTEINGFAIDALQSAIVTVESIGENWFASLCKNLLKMTAKGCKTVIVSIPSSRPLPVYLDEKLSELNLIFCGLALRSLEDVQLSYVLITEPVDFKLIEVYSPVSRKLLAHIEKHYQYAFVQQ